MCLLYDKDFNAIDMVKSAGFTEPNQAAIAFLIGPLKICATC